jgi:chorismate mutase
MMMAGLKTVPLADWGIFPADKPWLIAGPCSVESELQIAETARQLKASLGDRLGVLRAGVWKLRTHPGGFEGVGAESLPWLLRVRRETGLKICTEVICGDHVRACLDAGVDMIWIGARTTPNPYLVQDIADALQGADIPVLVKNPIGNDLELWSGALERLACRGVRKLGLVHRGVSSLTEKHFRNDPAWDLAARMHALYPELPILFDPSHIAGMTAYIPALCRQALDKGFDGLMIESHYRPAEALSDAAQQLTPADLASLLESLK